MQAVLDTVSRAAAADVSVLFHGESGTGKGLLARLLHEQSRRRDLPFVVTNCPTLSEDLIASELFGHARGSFTGAVRDQIGRVEAAEGGTVFLDEIGEICGTRTTWLATSRQAGRGSTTRPRRASCRICELELPRPMLDCAVSVAFCSRASDIGFTIAPVRNESTCWRSGTLNAGVARA